MLAPAWRELFCAAARGVGASLLFFWNAMVSPMSVFVWMVALQLVVSASRTAVAGWGVGSGGQVGQRLCAWRRAGLGMVVRAQPTRRAQAAHKWLRGGAFRRCLQPTFGVPADCLGAVRLIAEVGAQHVRRQPRQEGARVLRPVKHPRLAHATAALERALAGLRKS